VKQEREVIVVYGKTGMGKSRWTKRYLKTKKRVMICDGMDEHEGQKFEDLSEMLDHCEQYPTFRVRSEWWQDAPMMAAIAMSVNDPKRFGEGKKIPELVLAIEESQRALPAGAKPLPSSIENALYRGRHHHVTLVAISQRPSTVHIGLRSQWTRLVVFHQTEGADLNWLHQQTGEPEEAFSSLKPGEYFEFTPLGALRQMLPDQRAVTPLHSTGSLARPSSHPESGEEKE
jgi:hypothetical protein